MSDDYSGEISEEPPSSDVGEEGSEDNFDTPASGENDDQPELDDDGNPNPIPYARFKQSRQQYRDLKEQVEGYRQRHDELSSKYGQMEEYARQMHYAQQQKQSKASDEDDFYVDPVEKQMTQLQTKLDHLERQSRTREHESLVKSEETKIRSELGLAKRRFPDMDELYILDALAKNPNARIADLAKRSHEDTQKRFQSWASQRGYKAKPRRLVPSGQKGLTKAMDFGDDLDKAERAAIEYLNSME